MQWPEHQELLAAPQLLHQYVNITRAQAVAVPPEANHVGDSSPFTISRRPLACHRAWDARQARFDKCFLPVISLVPGVVAILVLLFRVLRPVLRKRPPWLKPFVVEEIDDTDLVKIENKRNFSSRTKLVIVIVIIGLSSDIVALVWPHPDFVTLLPAISWATILLLLVIDRPRSTPKGALVILCSTAAVQLTLQLNHESRLQVQDIPGIVAIFAAFGAFATMVCIPLRNVDLPHDDISAPFEKPTKELRSPEDRITLWQWATVTWMNPLINIGYERQLNDEDVWQLPYQWHHQGLHQRFRELQGSVIKRLLKANAIDLIIIASFGVLELACKYSLPMLLQLLLQSMEDISAPRRAVIVYAIFALCVRLVKAQSEVFSLWYERRSYERSRGEMITMLHEKVLHRKIVGATLEEEDTKNDDKKDADKQKQPASTGKILNLMKNDVYEIAQRFWEVQRFIDVPVGLVISIALVWKLVGWSCILGIIITVLAQAFTALIMRYQLKLERIRRAATDVRLQKTSQFIEAIRHLRWYGWQDFWLDQILRQRQNELKKRLIADVCDVGITLTQSLASDMFPVAVFYVYTAWAGLPLRVDVAFPALQLFLMVQRSLREVPRLVNILLRARISMRRIEEFMNEPDKEELDEKAPAQDTNHQVHIENACFAWPGKDENVLHDIDLHFDTGMTVIFGEVASGKSALLQAILGELDTRSGRVNRANTAFGYCAQSPWLQSMSIRDNILFSSPFEEERYFQVLDACALTVDLVSFKDGDLSLIGENGIGLSGGQRARVALARAVYSHAPTLLLDDPLSALDHQTAEAIVQKCFNGPLVKGRTVILVTHRVELCQSYATQTVEVTSGTASALDHEPTSEDLVKVKTQESEAQADKGDKKDQPEEKPEGFIGEEERAQGEVKYSVYWKYIKAGGLINWAVIIIILALSRVLSVAQDYFLKEWAEAYDRPAASQATKTTLITGLFDEFPNPEENVYPWLWGFFGIGIAGSVAWVIRDAWTAIIVFIAGKGMFRDVMKRVSNATFRFYDVTPVGRLMNRMTSDIGTMDGGLSDNFVWIALFGLSWVTSIVVIASVTPVFLVFSCVLVAGFVYVFLHFLPTSQSLRRLEMVSLSPLMSNFGNLINGLTTVRAFSVQKRFQDQVIDVTDNFQKMDHFYWSLQAWLSWRFDFMSAASTFILTMLAIYTDVSPGLTAFTLISASNFVNSTHALCRMYGRLQMTFVSVERIIELFDLEQESKGSVDPPASWPKFGGDIAFDDVTIKYAPHFDPALHNISFRIPGGSTTALLGRTGSGKSTLALSLLATILPTTGTIEIDGVDVSKVNKQSLRHRITFLAQDPVLFPGSMRENLDPLSEHTDEECDSVLQRVCAKHSWKLETQIDSGGSNLSQGQRQLVGLTRAVLRRSPIIILDEATASIDTETALSIQQILRDEMRESTVITIAHRLEAVKNADFFIRLDHGKIIDQGHVDPGAFDGDDSLGLAGERSTA